MKDRRGAGFPFSIGCMSQSAVAVADPLEKKQTQADPPSSSTTSNTTTTTHGAGEEGGSGGEEKAVAPGIVAAGVQRLIKGIKMSLSQMFATDGDGEEEEEEREIVIGYPTDVQHVGHIGWDGLNKVGGMGMVSAFSLPSSLSLRQLEIAMEGST